MNRKLENMEFEGTVDEQGRIALPPSVLAGLDQGSGSTVHVRVTRKMIHSALERRSVTEEEIGRIAAVQLETREQVVKFLLSEGGLRGAKAFKARGRR